MNSKLTYPHQRPFIPEEDLKSTERLLKSIKFSQSKTSTLCKEWVKQREESIDLIDRLEKKLDSLHRGCNVAHGAGSAMEIAGGVAMVAGLIFTALGHKSIGQLLTKKVSTVTLGAGAATSVSSSVVEVALTNSTLKEVKEVLNKDKEYTKKLMQNLDYARKIDKNLKRIFNCSVLSDNFLDVVRLCNEFIPLLEVGCKEFSKLWNDIKSGMFKCSDISDYSEFVIENVHTTMKNLSKNQKARESVKNICDIFQRSPLIAEFIKTGLTVCIEVCDVFKGNIVAILLGVGFLATDVGVRATKCVLGTALVAVSVFSLYNVIQNMQKDSSKYSKLLNELKLALTLELDSVRNKYLKPL